MLLGSSSVCGLWRGCKRWIIIVPDGQNSSAVQNQWQLIVTRHGTRKGSLAPVLASASLAIATL
eukprot:COSAG03_NODE_414_length_8107_cov_3.535090_2_plen_64_part_00